MQQLVALVERIKSATPSDDMVAKFELKPTDRKLDNGGILPEELKRFCAVCLNARSELGELHIELQAQLAEIGTPQPSNEEQRREVCLQHFIGHEHLRVAETIFWSEVRCAFPETINYGGIAIRKDWQVVVFTANKCCCDRLKCGGCFSTMHNENNMSFDILELLSMQT